MEALNLLFEVYGKLVIITVLGILGNFLLNRLDITKQKFVAFWGFVMFIHILVVTCMVLSYLGYIIYAIFALCSFKTALICFGELMLTSGGAFAAYTILILYQDLEE